MPDWTAEKNGRCGGWPSFDAQIVVRDGEEPMLKRDVSLVCWGVLEAVFSSPEKDEKCTIACFGFIW
jgi:hypothetical protein